MPHLSGMRAEVPAVNAGIASPIRTCGREPAGRTGFSRRRSRLTGAVGHIVAVPIKVRGMKLARIHVVGLLSLTFAGITLDAPPAAAQPAETFTLQGGTDTFTVVKAN